MGTGRIMGGPFPKDQNSSRKKKKKKRGENAGRHGKTSEMAEEANNHHDVPLTRFWGTLRLEKAATSPTNLVT